MKPYVGVASVTSELDFTYLAGCIPLNIDRKVAIGVWVSSKTIRGEKTKYPKREVKLENIPSIFLDKRALNLVHYNTDNLDMYGDLEKIVEAAGENLGGIQINQNRGEGDFDSVAILRKFSGNYRDRNLRVILQVRPDLDKSLDVLKFNLIPYVPHITDILLDLSLGVGKQLDDKTVNSYLQILTMINSNWSELGLGVAGGLSYDNLSILTPLVNAFPWLSIDAESRLRDEHDNLDLAKAQQYLVNAFSLFGQ